MKYQKHSFNYKLMVSYFALVWVIVGLISVSSYVTFRGMYQQSVDEMNQKTLRATVELYEEKIFQPVMKLYTDFLGKSGTGKAGNLFYSKNRLDTMEIYEIHHNLRSEVIGNSCISEIHLYDRERQQMISSRFGYKSGEDAAKILSYYSMENISEDASFPIITAAFQYPDEDSFYYNIIYSTNLGGRSRQGNTGFILFTMNSSRISEMMNQNEEDRVYIVSQDGTILCHPQMERTGQEPEFLFEPGLNYSVYMEKNTVISCMKSPTNNQYFVVETSMDGFYPAVRQLIGRMIWITAGMILLGGVAALVMSRHMAKPIQQAMNLITETLPDGEKAKKQDLEEIVNTICDEFQSLEQFTKSNKETIKNNYLLNLYLNQTKHGEGWEGKKAYIGFSGKAPCQPALVSWQFQKEIGMETKQMAVYKYIHDMQNLVKDSTVIAGETEENILAVVSVRESREEIRSFLEKTAKESSGRIVVYLGRECGGDMQVGQEFAFLKEMLSYQFFYPEKQVWEAETFAVQKEAVPEVNLNDFVKWLKSYQLEACQSDLVQTLENMDRLAICSEKRQEILLKYISAVSDTARAAGIHLEEMKHIIESENILVFQENFKRLMEEFRDTAVFRTQSKKHEEADAIKQFIAEHYDQDISLNMIAENMHMSPSYISRFFKEQTGMNITEYMKEIKLSEAEKLLVATEYSVEKIARMIGYNTTHYFIRQFKEKYGETPTVYRKKYNAK
ncbi:MAG: AraC family transcriptional regulator [bacterium]|nr:AraC family transcriptional regulator [bacterium]